MQPGSLVQCIRGHVGILNEGDIYTVTHVSPQGNLLLDEVSPPAPHTIFDKTRFKEVQPPMDVQTVINEIIFLEI